MKNVQLIVKDVVTGKPLITSICRFPPRGHIQTTYHPLNPVTPPGWGVKAKKGILTIERGIKFLRESM